MFEADRKISSLAPEMRTRVNAWLSACESAGLKVLITETRRSKARQLWLYAKGRVISKKTELDFLGYDDPAIESAPKEKIVTWTLKSNHISGLAIDFGFLDSAGKFTYNGDWTLAYSLAAKCGLKSLFLASGVDRPHLDFDTAFDLKNMFNATGVDKKLINELEAEFARRSAIANDALASLNEIKQKLAVAKRVPFISYKIINENDK